MAEAALQNLIVPDEKLTTMAFAFCQEMTAKLAGRKSDFKMLSSYLSPATGKETGTFLALDFGGTNVRLWEIELLGERKIQRKRQIHFPLKGNQNDYTSSDKDAEDLFGVIAAKIAAFVEPDKNYALGHTFSFPFQQRVKNEAVLLTWTKEIGTSGVVGCDVTKLLIAALAKQSLQQIRPVAVLNDTVATLLAASYLAQDVTIGAICGTGFNSCCVLKTDGEEHIVNLESGNFSFVPLTPWDLYLDAISNAPGAQLLEKTVSGGYLGKLATVIFSDLAHKMITPGQEFSSADLAALLQDEASAHDIAAKLGLTITQEEAVLLNEIAQRLAERSAKFAAASFAGILRFCDPDMARHHTIAIDGSLYEKMPGYREKVQEGLFGLLGSKAAQLELILCKDGSGIGAAVAAAMETADF